MEQAQPATKEITWKDNPYYILDLGVGRCRRYHGKMAAFYWWLSNAVLCSNALLGAGAFVALIGGKSTIWAQVMIGTVAAVSAIDSVLGFAKRAKAYDDLNRRFTELAAEIVETAPDPTSLKRLQAKRLRIEKDERPVMRLIDLLAQNEEWRARGYAEDQMAKLSKWQRWFGYICTFDMERLEREEAIRPRH